MRRNKFPKIMGILNITPDSFSDGNVFLNEEAALSHALQMLDNGADIIDVGGESTRPGAGQVAESDEMSRVLPVIKKLRELRQSCFISIDTTKYEVAKAALDSGANIINDISALKNDIRIAELAAANNIPLILMHMSGTPRTMQINPVYSDIVEDIYTFLSDRIALARSFGVSQLVADVGIGFGKTSEHNLTLLKNLNRFKELNVPLLLGISRKAFIGKLLGIEKPEERDIPTALLHALLIYEGIDIIRVHNLEYISMLKKLFEALY